MILFHIARSVIDTTTMPGIRIWGILILEPITVLTNLILALTSLWAAYHLKRVGNKGRVLHFARLFFIWIAIGTFVGGVVGHALLHYTGIWGKIPGWYISMVGVAMLERAAIIQGRLYMKPGIGRFFSVFNYVEIAIFMVLSILTFNFLFVEIHAFYGLFVVVFCFSLYVFLQSKDKAVINIFVATFCGLLAALCHAMKWSIHTHFNYNDISHIFMTISVIYYYKGYSKLDKSLIGHGSRL